MAAQVLATPARAGPDGLAIMISSTAICQAPNKSQAEHTGHALAPGGMPSHQVPCTAVELGSSLQGATAQGEDPQPLPACHHASLLQQEGGGGDEAKRHSQDAGRHMGSRCVWLAAVVAI
jgi:hypothetical protein